MGWWCSFALSHWIPGISDCKRQPLSRRRASKKLIRRDGIVRLLSKTSLAAAPCTLLITILLVFPSAPRHVIIAVVSSLSARCTRWWQFALGRELVQFNFPLSSNLLRKIISFCCGRYMHLPMFINIQGVGSGTEEEISAPTAIQ